MRKFEKILIGTIDQSTTGTKFTLFNKAGEQVEKTLIQHKQITPKQGWLEHNASEIWHNTQRAIQETLYKLDKHKMYSKEDIKTIGITNQRETVVAWNKETGLPYHNAIVWNDQRTTEICQRFSKKFDGNVNQFSQINGLPINTYFSAFKIKWLQENVDSLKKEQYKDNILYGTMDSWLVWNLTGRKSHITDVTNASRTFLMNLNTLEYEQDILKEFQIDQENMPEIKSSAQELGVISTINELKDIPITSILGDQQAASVGHGLFNQGNSKNTYGSGCFLLVNQGETPKFASEQGLLTTVLYQLGKNQKPVYGYEGSIESGALSINWVKDKLELFSDLVDLEQQVSTVKDNGGVYFVPALSGIYSPYWNANATGTIIGMSMYTERAHILRALLEAIAFRTKDVVEAVQKTGINIDSLKVDGGVTNNEFLMQFQCDILQKPIIKTKIQDSTCLGAAFAAGLGSGIYESIEEIQNLIEIESQLDFNTNFAKEAENLHQNWKRAVEKSLNWKQ